MKVKLRDVVDGLEMQAEEMTAYLNKRTGELVPISSEDLSAAEEDEDLDDYPEWQRESILKAKEILGSKELESEELGSEDLQSEDWIGLPEKIDIDEYAIMEEFCRSVADAGISERLLSSIRGKGAFGRFRGAVDVLDLRQEWFDFRAGELERIAVEWLEVNGIEYTRETASGKAVN